MIPVIDIGAIGFGAADTKDDELRSVGINIRRAFKTVGVCYLINHGIEQSVIDEYMAVCFDFFNQPESAKRDVERQQGGIYGWTGCEKETENSARPADFKETFNFRPSDFPDEWTHDEKFRTMNISMFEKLSTLSLRICDALSFALGLDKDFFRKTHALVNSADNLSTIRTLFYPALGPDRAIKPKQLRCGEHTDYGTFTLLYQDASGGLEVKVPDKGYVPVPPVPGTFLINIGDILQHWTADDLLAIEHRVVNSEEEAAKRNCRQSFGFFLTGDDDAVIKCTDGSDKYEHITCRQYLISKNAKAYSYM